MNWSKHAAGARITANGRNNGHRAPDAHEHRHQHGSHRHHHRHAGHHHEHRTGLLRALREIFTPHSHDAADSMDDALEASAIGIRAVKLSLVVLGCTAALQLLIVAVSGSVALAADTVHNFSDALTAVPLWIAFVLGRKSATRRYTYGFGRAEDLAGLFVVAMIALSALIAGYEAVRRMLDPVPIDHLGWVAAAGLIGFFGNETVALYRIRVGRRIGSAALVADGLHARTDGFTSLAVLLGAGGVALGFPLADPIVGLLITVAILAVLRTAARDVLRRLMDAVEPGLVLAAERALAAEPGVQGVRSLRMRWIGHRLHADVELDVAPTITLADAHRVAHDAEHTLTHVVPKLNTAVVHAYPAHTEVAVPIS
ncbi:cation diffusion facilitator family transporter [Nocardia sp. NPDC051787]|uniref:cation diffusion facilitator family transporter n=1 Tax=Nocardia sp. NPDC051787 TaxID=3155415 RepID=UPI00344280BB